MNKLNVIQKQEFSPEFNASNSGVSLLQLPPGQTNVGPKIQDQSKCLAAAGAAMIQGIPGERHQNTNISNNWLKDGKFGLK